MSGNVIFVGFAIQEGDRGLLARLLAALAASVAGACVGAAAVARATRRGASGGIWAVPITGALWLEWLVLVALAVVWHGVGDPGTVAGARIALIALAAFAMGIQSSAVVALHFRGVATTAITGTIHLLGSLLVRPPDPAGSASVPRWFLVGVVAAYVASALAVATTQNRAFAHLVPAIAVSVVLVLGRARGR